MWVSSEGELALIIPAPSLPLFAAATLRFSLDLTASPLCLAVNRPHSVISGDPHGHHTSRNVSVL